MVCPDPRPFVDPSMRIVHGRSGRTLSRTHAGLFADQSGEADDFECEADTYRALLCGIASVWTWKVL